MSSNTGSALKQLLHLVRWPNLLIIALSMYFVRHFILLPIFDAVNIESTLSPLYFFQLVFAVILIAGGGYVQNDLLDRKNDLLNKSKRISLQNNISEKELDSLYKLFFFIGNALGFYIALKAGRFQLGFVFLFATMLLILYNRIFKRQFLLGNIMIAGLSAFTLILVALFESSVIESNLNQLGRFLKLIYVQLLVYSTYAFVISLTREIVKDIEDLSGDNAMGMQTLPIVLGIKSTKILVALFILLTAGATSYFAWYYAAGNQIQQASYIIAAVVLPLLITLYKLFQANSSKDYYLIGFLLKFIMLTGILSMPVFYYLIAN